MWKTYLTVMLGGAFGTGLRMWLSRLLSEKYGETFPVGTLVVNVVGCLMIGLFAALIGPQGKFPSSALTREFVMIGVLGGFTTFSAFGLQTFHLFTGGDWWRAGLYVFLSLVLCLLAVWCGHVIAAAIHGK
jgi:CrcB protein